jgi:hypothetical protein
MAKVGDIIDVIGDLDKHKDKRAVKRIILQHVEEKDTDSSSFESKNSKKAKNSSTNENKSRSKVILITWKGGLFEEDLLYEK